MCGIIGYIGYDNAKNVLIKGLKSLEYRGYDSVFCYLSVAQEKKIKYYHLMTIPTDRRAALQPEYKGIDEKIAAGRMLSLLFLFRVPAKQSCLINTNHKYLQLSVLYRKYTRNPAGEKIDDS